MYGLSWSEFTEHFIENTQDETDGMTQTVKDRMMNSTHKLCTIKQLCIINVDVTYTCSDKGPYRVIIIVMYIVV